MKEFELFRKQQESPFFSLVAAATLVMALAATIGLLHSKQLQQVWETRILLLQHCKFNPLYWTTIFTLSCFTTKKECVKKPKTQIPMQSAIAIAIN
jgi:isoprenylcysteine carboxyl methyltransferase (ICMT) family protein YpbQ